MNKLIVSTLAAVISLVASQPVRAVVSFAGSYSQDFNTLITSGTVQTWANDSTLSGWSLFQYTGGAIADYNAGDGTSNAGHFYSFGTGTATDRALGGAASSSTYFGTPGPASGAVAGYIAVAIQNTSGNIFDNFTLSFSGEQWRNGGNTSPQTMTLQYGFGTSFAAVTTWNTPGGLFNYASPVTGATAAAVDGNVAGLVTGLGGTISSLTWNNGDTLWVCWIENNDAGNDHGLAIDNFSITAVPVPEPATLALATLGGLAGLVVLRRKR